MKSISVILWDVDDTLIDFKASETMALCLCLERAGAGTSPQQLALYRQINHSYWKRLERGEVTKQRVFCGRFEDYFAAIGLRGIDAARFNDDYQQALGQTAVLNDGAREVCAALYGKIPQYVVSNGSAVAQRGKLALTGLASYMETLFISEELGAEKPSVAFFEGCFSQIPGFSKERAIIIGDSLTSDIRGANNAGIPCCWYNPDRSPAPDDLRIDYNISDLREILEILEIVHS